MQTKGKGKGKSPKKESIETILQLINGIKPVDLVDAFARHIRTSPDPRIGKPPSMTESVLSSHRS